MDRLSLVRLVGSLSVVVLATVAGCGGSPALTPDAGTDAPMDQPDARDFCDPLVLRRAGEDPCVLSVPAGFYPQRVFYEDGAGGVALELFPDETYCDSSLPGFYLDDETSPTLVTLCAGACEALPAPLPEIFATACGI